MKDNDIKENPAFKKYLRLKERQRKLRALRGGVMDSTESDELSDIVMDHMSETRSVMSLVSHNQGTVTHLYLAVIKFWQYWRLWQRTYKYMSANI